jgi:hypothetical protein
MRGCLDPTCPNLPARMSELGLPGQRHCPNFPGANLRTGKLRSAGLSTVICPMRVSSFVALLPRSWLRALRHSRAPFTVFADPDMSSSIAGSLPYNGSLRRPASRAKM